MAYGDFNDLLKGTASHKVSRDKASNIAKNLKYDGYQRGFASMVNEFFDKKFLGDTVTHADDSGIKIKIMPNQ